MKRRFPLYTVITFIASVLAAGCNDDSTAEYEVEDPATNAVMVNSFNLMKNDSVLANLDSVFFSIDLDRALIFNADSLPMGTRVNRLQVNIGLPALSKAEITMPNDRGIDTVVNYLTNSTDSINFSRGSVKLHLESANGQYKRDYTIYVNVHKINPDSLQWSSLASSALPSQFASADAQRTVEYKGKVLCFTQSGNDICRATSTDPSADTWTKETVTLPANARISSITAGSDCLYMIAGSDELYSSADEGSTWTATGTSMSHIYGTLGNTAVGVRNDGSVYTHLTYPATTETEVPASCPVSGTSPAIVYTSDWSQNPMLIVAGGRKADGSLTGQTWAYDGGGWAAISLDPLPATEGMMVVPYFAFKTSNSWRVTEQSLLLAFGGADASGVLTRTVYISNDYGVHWQKASQLMQLPSGVTFGRDAQAILIDRTFTSASRSAARWNEITLPTLRNAMLPVPESRATTPITQWECPYIYVFGGTSANGTLYNRIIRGVINRLTFKPLQ